MKTLTQKIKILEAKGWKIVNSLYFGGMSYVSYSNPKNGMILQFNAKSETEHSISILP